MATGTTAENAPYKRGKGNALASGDHAAYTPSADINPLSYGKSGPKAVAQGGDVPSVVVGGSSEVGVLPKWPDTLVIGEDKNVSTPVSS